MRKQADYDVTDRVDVMYSGSEAIVEAISEHAAWIRNETLCLELDQASKPTGDLVTTFDINSEQLTISVSRIA